MKEASVRSARGQCLRRGRSGYGGWGASAKTRWRGVPAESCRLSTGNLAAWPSDPSLARLAEMKPASHVGLTSIDLQTFRGMVL